MDQHQKQFIDCYQQLFFVETLMMMKLLGLNSSLPYNIESIA
jgi:hypothetical protein